MTSPLKALHPKRMTYDYRKHMMKQIFVLAKKRMGLNAVEMTKQLNGETVTSGFMRRKLREGERIPIERFLKLCYWAGIPRSWAMVLWAKAAIPDEYAQYRAYIGCTRQYPQKRDWAKRPGRPRASDKNTPEAFKDLRVFLKEHTTSRRPELSDDPKDYMGLSGQT